MMIKNNNSAPTEVNLTLMVAEYLAKKYPDVDFHFDFGSGMRMTMGQARKQYMMNAGRRGHPDMAIYAPSVIDGKVKHGLFLELKRDGVRLKKKDGSFATTHIWEQSAYLDRLTARGYVAQFAVGFDDAKKKIDDYLKGRDQAES